MRRILLLMLVLPLLSSCIFFESPATKKMRASPNYRAGYSDGCASAGGPTANMRTTNDVRDSALSRTDKDYRAGWAAGYNGCKTARPTDGPQSGPIPDPYPPR